MDQRVIQQSRKFKNIQSSNGIKALMSERKSLKLYIDNTSPSFSNNLSSKLNTDRTLTTQQKEDKSITTIHQKTFFKQPVSVHNSNKNSGEQQLKISDLIRKKSSTQTQQHAQSATSNIKQKQRVNSTHMENKEYITSQMMNDGENTSRSKQDILINNHNLINYQQDPYLQQNQFQSSLQKQQETNRSYYQQANEIKYMSNKPSMAINSVNNFFTEYSTKEHPYQKEEKKSDIFKINSPNSKFTNIQSGSFQQKFDQKIEGLRRPQTAQVVRTKKLSKGSFCILDKKDSKDDLRNYQSVNENNSQKFSQQKNQNLQIKVANCEEENQTYQSKNEDQMQFHQKKMQEMSSSFQSNSSESGKSGLEVSHQEKNGKQIFQLQPSQIPSKSVLGSTCCTTSFNSTPIATGLIQNPEQITKQLVKQNLMIFNRKQLFTASNQKHSNTYTTSQKIIFQQNQNKNLYKQYSQQNKIIQQNYPQVQLTLNKNIVIEGEKTPQTLKSSKTQTPSIQFDTDEISFTTKLMLSKSILQKNQLNRPIKSENREILHKPQENIIKKQNNFIIDNEIFTISQAPENSSNKTQKTENEKQSVIKDIISKRNTKQIPLIEAPFFQNQKIQAELNNNISELNNQITRSLSPRTSDQKQFTYTLQIGSNVQFSRQNSEYNQLNSIPQIQFSQSDINDNNKQTSEIKQEVSNQLSMQTSQQLIQKIPLSIQTSNQSIQSNIDPVQNNPQSIQNNQQAQNYQSFKTQQEIQNDTQQKSDIKKMNSERCFSQIKLNQNLINSNNIKDDISCNKSNQLFASPGEMFLQRLSPRPQTAISYKKKNNQQLNTQNSSEQLFSKVLPTEKNTFIDESKARKDTLIQYSQNQFSHNEIKYFDENKTSYIQENSKPNQKKQVKQKSQAKIQDNKNQAQQFLSPWQNIYTPDQCGDDDSLDFIQYTISS